MNRLSRPMVLASAAYIVAGGAVHLREWLVLYRHIPSSIPGAFVVQLGFPLNAAASLLIAGALVLSATVWPRLTVPVAIAAIAFQATSLAVLLATRTGAVFGWSEPTWSGGASQSRALEIGALITLAVALGLRRAQPSRLAPAVTPR